MDLKKNMDELSDYTSPVIEFKACDNRGKQFKLVENSTATDPPLQKIDVSVETLAKISQKSQTKTYQNVAKNVDERKLTTWLQKIYPNVEKELFNGCTPLKDTHSNYIFSTYLQIQPYQKISFQPVVNSQGLAIWLSLHTNNAPVLVVTTVAPHSDWCEHVDQNLKLFIPQRIPNGHFVIYKEIKSIPIKACMKSLCTNPFNKNVFAGSTHDGDIYIWQYKQHFRAHSEKQSDIKISKLHHITSLYGYALAMDWSGEHTLLTAHMNNYVIRWHLGKKIMKEEYFVKSSATATTTDISTLLSLNTNEFIVGTKDGSILHCSNSSLLSAKRNLEIKPLKKHLFMTSTLLRANINGHSNIISCDLSGQLYYHDLRNLEDDNDTLVVQLPLPFTSIITCSRDGSIIFSPGEDGSLECYSLNSGVQHTVKGVLKGKGNFIKSSDNGCWIITGIYEKDFQIFSIET